MGKQKLTDERVELIKFMINSKTFTQKEIAEYFGVKRPCVSKIKQGQRWTEINTPDEMRGKYLWYKLLNKKMR